MLLAEIAKRPFNVLEWSFLGALAAMTVVIGILSVVVIARVVEPKGLKVLLKRLAGKD